MDARRGLNNNDASRSAPSPHMAAGCERPPRFRGPAARWRRRLGRPGRQRAHPGHVHQPGSRRGLPRPCADQAPTTVIITPTATQTLRDGRVDQYPGHCDRPTSSTGSISAMRFPEKPVWAKTTQDFWAPSVIFDGSTYFMYYSATPDVCHYARARPRACGRGLGISNRARSSTGPAAAVRRRVRHSSIPMAFDDPVDGQAPALLGLRLPADPGSGACPRPNVFRRRRASRSISSGRTARTAPSRAWSKLHG